MRDPDLLPHSGVQDKYRDTRDVNHIKQRKTEALIHLQQIENLIKSKSPEFTPQSILEIGSGMGSVTAGLRTLFPKAQILASDIDRDPEIKQAAQANGATFDRNDIVTKSPQQFADILQKYTIDSIIAMRTSGKVARYLLKATQEANFDGLLTFSLITMSDRSSLPGISATVATLGGQSLDLHSDNPFTEETAFVINFSSK